MKLSGLLTLLPLLLSSSVVYASGTRDVFQARQAHVKKSLVDVCAALDLDVNVGLVGHNIVAGHLNLCLCLSVLPGFLDSHPVAKKVVNGAGRDGARDYFAGLIQNQKSKQECRYPGNARPFCSISNPCDFTCEKGYTPSPSKNPTDCVCKPPYSECNGMCGSFPHGCGSQGLSKERRDYPICSAGKTVCGVPNGKEGYDCVDINTDVESCGGCTVASPFGNNVADGKNCKTIHKVERVFCDEGSCKVLSCKDGYKVSRSHDSCVQPRLERVREVRGGQVHDVDSLLSLIVGHGLFVKGYDLVSAKERLNVSVKVFNVDHVLEVLLGEKAIIDEILDLIHLKARLELDVSV